MKKSMSMDLTALLDVILIILFAVMLNISQTSKNTEVEEEALRASVADYKIRQDELEKLNQNLTEELDQSLETLQVAQEETKVLELQYESMKALDATLNEQQIAIIRELIDIGQLSDLEKSKIIDAQGDSDLMADALAKLTKTPEDARKMLESIYKYSVVANKFLFLDLTIDVVSGEVIFDNNPSGIIINENDGFDSRLFQLKKEALVDHMFKAIRENDRTYSFILITTKYDPYLTRKYYLTLINDAIDDLRNENDAYIIFDTEYLIN